MSDLIERLENRANRERIGPDAHLLRSAAAYIKQLEAVAKCDCCGKPFDENGGICEPCHSSAIAQHIKPLGSRIRELEAAVQSETANKLAANLKVIALEAERDQFMEQAAARDQRDADMQELMRINNELVAERDKLQQRLDLEADSYARDAIEAATIERCAQEADWFSNVIRYDYADVAKRIRALKPSGEEGK